MIEAATGDVLGRHVGNGTEQGTILGQIRRWDFVGIDDRRTVEGGVSGLVDQFCETEVEHLDVTRWGDHHIVGFEITMGDAAFVGDGDRGGQLFGDTKELRQGQAPLGNHLAQGLSLDQLHGDEVDLVVGLDSVDGDDVGVVHGCNRPRLGLKPLQPLRIGHCLGRQDLERYPPTEPGVLSDVDLAHAAAGQPFDHLVVREHVAGCWKRSTVVAHVTRVSWSATFISGRRRRARIVAMAASISNPTRAPVAMRNHLFEGRTRSW